MSEPARRKQKNHPGAIGLVALLAVLTVLVVVLGNKVFVVKTISVEGNRYCSAEEVMRSAGIQYGDGMFSIDTARVRNGINANRYLEYVGIWRDFPSRVILTVKEHSPRATLTWTGMLVMLGENGVVLEKTAQIDIALDVPVITGIDVARADVGQPIAFKVSGQFEAIFSVLAEADRQGMSPEISELNVAVLDNLYLVTEDGLEIVLGDSGDLENKLLVARAAVATLRGKQELRGAVLDVSSGQSADYRPPSSGTTKTDENA